jgi:hypothetical protein
LYFVQSGRWVFNRHTIDKKVVGVFVRAFHAAYYFDSRLLRAGVPIQSQQSGAYPRQQFVRRLTAATSKTSSRHATAKARRLSWQPHRRRNWSISETGNRRWRHGSRQHRLVAWCEPRENPSYNRRGLNVGLFSSNFGRYYKTWQRF